MAVEQKLRIIFGLRDNPAEFVSNFQHLRAKGFTVEAYGGTPWDEI